MRMNKRNPNNRQREIIATFQGVFGQTSGIESTIELVDEFLENKNIIKGRRVSK